MTDETLKPLKAELEIDHQHGPKVRVTVGDAAVAVYLMDETAVVTTPKGQAGLEVGGPWHEFRKLWNTRQPAREPVADPERIAQLIAHRACCAGEHDPANGKEHGCCIVCGIPWPCEYAGTPPDDEARRKVCLRGNRMHSRRRD